MAPSASEAFGTALRQLREERGLSQEAAALRIGVDRAYLGTLERATKSPTVGTLFKIADALDTRPSLILARAERLRDQG